MQEIVYTIHNSRRARHARITVRRTGEVVVTMPLGMPHSRLSAWVRSKLPWIERAVARVQQRRAGSALPGGARAYYAHRERARAFIHKHLAELNALYHYVYKTVRIKRHTGRWGSCSSKGNLNFNYQTVFLPDHLARYIVAHELCHLKEMNHSRAFWELVARTVPTYRACRKELHRFTM